MTEHKSRNSQPKPIDDKTIELMADAALGPDPDQLPPEGDPLHLPGDGDPGLVHRKWINDRMRSAKIMQLPEVADVFSARRKKVFLVTLAETGIIGQACARAGWARSVPMGLRKSDKEFKARYDEALEFAADIAEAEAFRRGVHGTLKDVYFKGEVVGQETVYSDKMLELTLKARRPERFRESHNIALETKGGVLVIPAAQSEGDWEKAAEAGQAKFREVPDDS